MAQAPKPGTTNKPQAEDAAAKIVVRGVEAIVRPGDFGPRDDALVRKEAKAANLGRMSLAGALGQLDEDSIGLDSVCLLWWISRRRANETTQSLGDCMDSFPSYGEAEEAIDITVLGDEDEDDEDASPEV